MSTGLQSRETPTGVRRTLGLYRAFRLEQQDPDGFYRLQAADTVAQVLRYTEVAGKTVLDVGGGVGYFTEAFRSAGAHAFLLDPSAAEVDDGRPDDLLTSRERHRRFHRGGKLVQGFAVAGDGVRLPIRESVADITFSSNVLEHVMDPVAFLEELVRITRPGGILYVSFTVWLSPWGGHETSPWHYLGGRFAARRYERRQGDLPRNVFGESLYARHVGTTLRLVKRHQALEIVDVLPRYHPDWLRGVVRIPLVRELATWNLLLLMRRR